MDCHCSSPIATAPHFAEPAAGSISHDNKAFYVDIIKKITRVAVLAISAYFMLVPTIIGFTAGVIIGAVMQARSEEELPKGSLMQLCILGYMEFASDSKWNEVVVTALTAASFLDCIWHGSPFFSCMISGGVGFWVGKEVAWFAKGFSREELTI